MTETRVKFHHAILSLLILGVAQFSLAQNKSPEWQPYFSSLIVSDMKRSVDWYTTVLGFKIENQVDSKERGFKQCNLKTETAALELIELQSAVSPGSVIPDYNEKTRIVGYFKWGISVADFDTWMEHLNRHEVNRSGTVVNDPATGKRMAIILDPDGNRIQLFEIK